MTEKKTAPSVGKNAEQHTSPAHNPSSDTGANPAKKISSDTTDVHFVMQGKGGVGKTTIASLLSQYLKDQDPQTLCIDADPVNASLSDFKALDPFFLPIVENGEVNQRIFDELVEKIAETPHDVVIDSGASTFLPLTEYLSNGPVYSILRSIKRRPVFHTVIAGGPSQLHTLQGLNTLLETAPEDADIVLWINEYHGFGKVLDRDGNPDWENIQIIKANKDRFRAVICLPTLNAQTYGEDFREVMTKGMTFEEATKPGSGFKLMAQARLREIWNRLKEEISNVQ